MKDHAGSSTVTRPSSAGHGSRICSEYGPAVMLYVGNIPWEATEEEVMAACAAVLQSRVLRFHLVRNFDGDDIIPGSPKRRLHRGFGLLELQDEETAMAAIRKHKRLPIICSNRRLRIDYPKQQLPSSNRSSVVVHSQQELEIKHQIEHQNILLTSSCSDKKTQSSSAVNADPSERKSPRIFQDQPKEKKTKSSSPVLNAAPSDPKSPRIFQYQPKEKNTKSSSAANAVPSEKKTPIFKDHPKEKKNSINSAHSAPISGQQNSSILELLDRHVKEKQKTTPESKKRPHSAIFATSSAGSCLVCSQLLMPVQYGEGKLQIPGADHVRDYTSVRCYYCNSPSKRQRFVRNDPKKSDSPQSSSLSVARGELSTQGADAALSGQLESDLLHIVHILSCTHIQ